MLMLLKGPFPLFPLGIKMCGQFLTFDVPLYLPLPCISIYEVIFIFLLTVTLNLSPSLGTVPGEINMPLGCHLPCCRPQREIRTVGGANSIYSIG